MQTIENTAEISKLRMNIGSVEKQMSDVMDQLNEVVTKSELARIGGISLGNSTLSKVDLPLGKLLMHETVCLLSKLHEAKHHINVEVDMAREICRLHFFG